MTLERVEFWNRVYETNPDIIILEETRNSEVRNGVYRKQGFGDYRLIREMSTEELNTYPFGVGALQRLIVDVKDLNYSQLLKKDFTDNFPIHLQGVFNHDLTLEPKSVKKEYQELAEYITWRLSIGEISEKDLAQTIFNSSHASP